MKWVFKYSELDSRSLLQALWNFCEVPFTALTCSPYSLCSTCGWCLVLTLLVRSLLRCRCRPLDYTAILTQFTLTPGHSSVTSGQHGVGMLDRTICWNCHYYCVLGSNANVQLQCLVPCFLILRKGHGIVFNLWKFHLILYYITESQQSRSSLMIMNALMVTSPALIGSCPMKEAGLYLVTQVWQEALLSK